MESVNPWEDPQELGRRLAAARAYHGETLDEYGVRIGKSGRTVQNMEAGMLGSVGRTPESRKHTAELAVEHGAPPEFFGLDELQHVTRAEYEQLVRELESNRDDPPAAPDEAGDE